MICTGCHQTKEPEEFSFKSKAKGIRHRKCKACIRARLKAIYQANPGAYRARNKAQVAAILAVIAAAKDRPCMDCGGEFPGYVMDLDHRPEETKIFNLSAAARQGYAIEVVQVEIEKCDVVCANCHRIRTFGGRPPP